MEVICKCGGRVRESTHEVKSAKGLADWMAKPESCELPAKVEQSECKSCGRLRIRVLDPKGEVVEVRG